MRSNIYKNKKYKVVIYENVIKIFNKYEQMNNKNESGGILIGNIYKDKVEIVNTTIPNKRDSSGLCYFIRAKKPAQGVINKSWKKSYGELIYLGEWHTHLSKKPIPSIIDKSMILNVLRTTEMEIDFVVLVIVGQDNSLWVGIQNSEGLKRLRCDNSDRENK